MILARNCEPLAARLAVFFPAALAIALGSLAAAARAATLAPDLQARIETSAPGSRIPVIIGLADRVNPAQFRSADRAQRRAALVQSLQAKAAQTRPAVVALMRAHGVQTSRSLWAINAIAAELPVAAIAALAKNPAVERIRLDAVIPAPGVTTAAAAAPEWNIGMVRAPEMWALGYDGSGVVVASMDTGVDAAHPDLASRWRGGSNSWYDPNGQHATPYDKTGHGTQTMGLMVGGDAGGSAIGIAPGARWIAVKIFNDSGQATLSNIHLGFQWLLDPDGNPASDDAPDVVNNSWGLIGSDQCVLEFQSDVQLLKAAGIAVVFAAGNDGPAGFTSSSPANNPEGYAVGAVAADDSVAPSSSRGPSACDGTVYPELVAPGVAVRSADLSFGGMARYVDVTGTSFAVPHVSGAMALLAQAHPAAEVAALEAALVQAARDLGSAGPDNASGHGVVDAVAAHDALGVPPPPANRAPLAGNDAYSVLAGDTLWVAAPGVLGNDSDPDGDTLSAQLESPPAGGTLALNADGSFSYTPHSGTVADSFSYRAADGALASDVSNVSISVLPSNQAPVALNDRAFTRRNRGITIRVLANDSDPDGSLDTASLAIVTQPSRGGFATANPDGTVRYIPKRRFIGRESFGYRVSDAQGAQSNTASVTVQVTRHGPARR
jgi:subtilisin family serine protease